jgi:TctA family transporter
VIGLFGISEILMTMEEGVAFRGKRANIDLKVVLKTWAELPRYWMTLIRSSIIGCWLGVTPGGATAASFMGYGVAKRFSRKRETFGKGNVEGVIAPNAPRTRPAPARCCRCWRLAFRGRPRRRCCWAA